MKFFYESRPFKVRNADEYDLSEILDLFVDPLDGLKHPFDFENSIVKGRMGSGKTIYLRANHAFHLYNMIPCICDHTPVVLPILINLCKFQTISDPKVIYQRLIIRIIEELSTVYLRLQDESEQCRLHHGMKTLAHDLLRRQKLSTTAKHLLSLGSDQYIQRLTMELGSDATLKTKFFDLSGRFRKEQWVEIQKKPDPSIQDVKQAYETLLGDLGGKVLLLLDEAGSLPRQFFKNTNGPCQFEILMNQLRTTSFLRTKVAVYPNTYDDILTETRYGDNVMLEDDIMAGDGYSKVRTRTIQLIYRYINLGRPQSVWIQPDDVFDISNDDYGDGVEQIIHASHGNIRRIIQLLDASMIEAYKETKGTSPVSLANTMSALKTHSEGNENSFSALELEFLDMIASVCRHRRTYRFTFPGMSSVIAKYTGRSREFNLVTILEQGSGRRGTTYAFDYSYCVAHDLPTHYLAGTERILRERTLRNGKWIQRVATISTTLVEHATVEGKIDGTIDYWSEDGGYINGDDGKIYVVLKDFIIVEDKKKPVIQGHRVRFLPSSLGTGSSIASAFDVELL